jgi:hypothetical protein
VRQVIVAIGDAVVTAQEVALNRVAGEDGCWKNSQLMGLGVPELGCHAGPKSLP